VNSRPVTDRVFVGMEHGAAVSGFSLRHFRRLIAEDRVPIQPIGKGKRKKFFIVARDFNAWLERRARTVGALVLLLLGACAHQVNVQAPPSASYELTTVHGSWKPDAARPDILWLYTEQTRDVQAALKEIGCGKTFYCQTDFGGTITVIQTTPKDSKH
jgi:hypothetical protein